jgi:hypothetical protein
MENDTDEENESLSINLDIKPDKTDDMSYFNPNSILI